MIIDLTKQEIKTLKNKNIIVDAHNNYTEREALEILDKVRDVEVSYSQGTDVTSVQLYSMYGDIADKIFLLIPQ